MNDRGLCGVLLFSFVDAMPQNCSLDRPFFRQHNDAECSTPFIVGDLILMIYCLNCSHGL